MLGETYEIPERGIANLNDEPYCKCPHLAMTVNSMQCADEIFRGIDMSLTGSARKKIGDAPLTGMG